jgi:hypothetical protein
LNRTIKWTKEGVTVEADAKHVKVLIKEMDLENAKEVKTPAIRSEGAKNSRDVNDDIDDIAEMDEEKVKDKCKEAEENPELGPAESSKYRSWTARVNYLSIDRPDIQFAVKSCAKGMSNPHKEDMMKLKRLARYLKYRPAMVCTMMWQQAPDNISMYTDSDWAGDKVSRKSTTGGAMMIGSHVLKTWSKDQSVIALSSGEAELYAANYSGAQALGMRSMAKDLGVNLEIDLLIDAQATMGIINRQGLGKVRHIEVQDLWLQAADKEKRVRLHKVWSEDNVADLMTKPLTQDAINDHLKGLCYST